MKIILSPAKEMNLNLFYDEDWRLNESSRRVIRTLQELSTEEIERLFKRQSNYLEKAREWIGAFEEEITYTAMDLYHGLAYRHLKKVSDWRNHSAYVEKHIRILSALYGAISPLEKIKPYRLDMTNSLRVEKKSLKQFWKKELATQFRPGESIINLASKEFSSLLNRSNYQWIDISFFERRSGKLYQHATLSKKARGKMAGWMIQHEVTEQESLKHFNLDNFTYQEELSNLEKLVFVKTV